MIGKLFQNNSNAESLHALEEKSRILEFISRSSALVLGSGTIEVHSFWGEWKACGYMIVDMHASSTRYLGKTKNVIHADHRNIAPTHRRLLAVSSTSETRKLKSRLKMS